jgi:pimeloyl-ACP methyl ester carboxylesterase
MYSSPPRLLAFLFLFGLNLGWAQSAPQPTPDSLPHAQEHSSEMLERSGEDWSTIELAKSGLPLESTGGFLISKVDLPGGCTRELLRMQWRPSDPIDLYVIKPGNAERLPVVLFLYNYNVDTDVFRQNRWCDRVTRNGFAAVGFPTALSWQRLHSPRPMKEWFVSELQEALATSTHDVQMVLNYLASRGDLDIHRVGVFGQGSGGAVAILAAAADPRISALDLMDPWGDWPDWLKESKQIPEEERAGYLEPPFLKRVAGLDPVTYLPLLKTEALRILQVADDPVTPAAAREKIASAVPGADEVIRYPNMTTEAKALGDNGIIGWLGEEVNSQQRHGGTVKQLSEKSKSARPLRIAPRHPTDAARLRAAVTGVEMSQVSKAQRLQASSSESKERV